jgi:cell division septal protein FtsQ
VVPTAVRTGVRTVRRRPATAGGAGSGRRRLVAALAAVAVAGACLGLHTRPFLLTQLRLSGLRQVTPAEIEVDLHLPAATYTWQLRPWVMRRRLLRDPLIAAAHVAIAWPNALVVRIQERLPAALLAVPGGLWEISAHGRLLRYLPAAGGVPRWEATAARAVPGLPPDLPVISGVSLVHPVVGRLAVGSGVRRTLRVALGLGGGTSLLRARIVWSGDSVQVLTGSGLRVDYGDGSAARQKTEILLGILRLVAQERVRLAAVDLRAPATPAVLLQPGSPPLVYDGRVGG